MVQYNSHDKVLEMPKTPNGHERYGQDFSNLMPFKVREILLVSSLYDAFIIEEEGLISEVVIKEYRHLLLSSPPHVTRVSSGKKALAKIKTRQHYDLVVTMSKNIGMDPFEFGKKIKELSPDLSIIQLITDPADLPAVNQKSADTGIDKVFFWNGDTRLILAIVKYVEDRINADYDTVNGNVRVIIMVEDSIRYYSIFLPIIYAEIVQQTQRSISEDLNEMQRLLRRRGRPKILLAETFEEGLRLYKQYKDNVLGIISDVCFKHYGKTDQDAGYKFIQMIKKEVGYIPTMIQSSNPEKRVKSEEIGAYFLHKNSPTLLQDFRVFLLNHLGFGDFIFLLPEDGLGGKGEERNIASGTIHQSTVEIAHASNMREFESALQKVPIESIRFHAERNDFSNWLMARGEFKLAMKLRPQKVSDFGNLNEVREYLTRVFNESRMEKQLGVITEFSQQKFEFDSSFSKIGEGSLGGKGRGIAFMRSLLARYNFVKKYKNINITVPNTVVIGTEEFDKFMSDNDLHRFMGYEGNISDNEIARAFLDSKLSKKLKSSLRKLLQHFKSPLAIRSSSLLEDSQNHPFAGIYSTYMLPNNQEDDEVRLKYLCQAIKLIYASVFFKEAKVYIGSTSSKIEEEKMAIIVQELVGDEYGGRFYPTFSGVAQSYNFYPVSHQNHEDGIVNVAVGLGKTVVDGEKVLRFSPRHPSIIPEFSTPELILENSQQELYVLNTTKKNIALSKGEDATLEKLNISDIKNDGTLGFTASTYDMNDGMIRDATYIEGAPVITFAGVLKYDMFPLPSLIQDILSIGKKGMGCSVEIEFAVNFDRNNRKPPVLAILQIRPLVTSQEECEISWDEDVIGENVFIRSNKSMGNGLVDVVMDIVYIPPERFDSSKTIEIADEVGKINKKLVKLSLPYILIGPGRWGTRDRWLGIPVKWSQISGVKVMVETSLKDFDVKPSQGTHFFQNITSRGIGYINISLNPKDGFIDWEWINKQKSEEEFKFVRHIRLSAPLSIKFNGRFSRALIKKPDGS